MMAMLTINARGMVTAGTTTYLGGLDFLNSQAAFVEISVNYPAMLTVTNEDKG